MADNVVALQAQDRDYSTKADERISCSYEGSPLSIGFNSVNMLDLLNNLPGDQIVVKLSDPGRTGLFMPFEQKENENLVMALMPMHLTE